MKPLQQEAQDVPDRIDFRIGFRNKKKDGFIGFYLRSKINYQTFYFMIALIANGRSLSTPNSQLTIAFFSTPKKSHDPCAECR